MEKVAVLFLNRPQCRIYVHDVTPKRVTDSLEDM